MSRRLTEKATEARTSGSMWAPLGPGGRLVRRTGADWLWTIASSRLPVAVDHSRASAQLRPWLDAVRSILLAAPPAPGRLLLMPGVTGHQLLTAVAHTFGVLTTCGDIVADWNAWRNAWKRPRRDNLVSISPPLVPVDPPLLSAPSKRLAVRDQVLWAVADQLELLYVRRRGGWSCDLRTMARRTPAPKTPRLLRYWKTCPQRACPQAAAHVSQLGGSLHTRRMAPPSNCETREANASLAANERLRPRAAQALWERRPVLTHFTRDRRGPWPQQSDESFGRLLLAGQLTDRSAAGVLKRIAVEARLRSSANRIRDGSSVVCFSALAPHQRRPRFQQHLRHWDAAPFGVAIDRQWLARRGAKPVIYGDQHTWESLPSWLRPCFQAAGSQGQWRAEQEWRWFGDLNLLEAPVDLVELFVPSQEDAEALQPFSRWTVRVARGA